MKTTIGKLKRIIAEIAGMKVAEIVYGHGMGINIDGRQYNVDNMCQNMVPGWDDMDDDDQQRATLDTVNDFLTTHGVTHVVDEESFGDSTPHPLAEFIALGERYFEEDQDRDVCPDCDEPNGAGHLPGCSVDPSNDEDDEL